MASFKEPQVARPPSQHRISMSLAPSHNLPIRHTTSRHHSHSTSLSSVNPSHRVTRRKSMNSTTVNNVAAIVAAVGVAEEPVVGALLQSRRRSCTMKSGGRGVDSPSMGKGVGTLADSNRIGSTRGVNDCLIEEHNSTMDESAVAEGATTLEDVDNISKARARRASEGAHLSKNESKRSNGELRCEKCGKGYKHSSCLTKHLWEHTPEWNVTSKLLISKHQQVQLLEAASVLIGMNQDVSTPDAAKTSDSDQSSDSPGASGTSELHDGEYSSSAETTPPPTSEQTYSSHAFRTGRSKRASTSSSAFSRSYQSAPSSSLPGGPLPPVGTSFGSYYQSAMPRRPSASGFPLSNTHPLDEDEVALARAVESLCSFGTPRTGPVHLPPDVPPVPPLPARFAGQNSKRVSANVASPNLQTSHGMPPPSTQQLHDVQDVKMSDTISTDDDEDYDERSVSHGRSDEDDDGVFGRMEE